MWAEPKPEFLAARWTYREAKAGLDVAGRLIDVSLAEHHQAQADPEGFRGARITLAAPDIAGAKTRRYRTTANTVFHVMEGSGETAIGDKTVIEPRKAIKHLVFATLRPDFARHFTFDAGDVIKIVPVMAGFKLYTRRAEIACSLVSWGCCSSECDSEDTTTTEIAATSGRARTRFIWSVEAMKPLSDPNAPNTRPADANHRNFSKVEKRTKDEEVIQRPS